MSRSSPPKRLAGRRPPPLAPDDIIDAHQPGQKASGGKVGTGVKWLGTSQLISQIIRVVAMLVLTQLLTPREFGVVSLITVVTGLFERVLGDTGTTAAVVRHPELNHGLASSVFWWNVTVGTVTSGAFVLLGGPVAGLLGQPDSADLVRVVGLMAFLTSFGHVQRALLRRRFLFRRLAVVNLANSVGTSVATIALAVAGTGVWALVIGSLIGSVASVILAWLASPWRPGFHFARRRLAAIGDFSKNLSLQNLFGYVSFAGDRFIIGRFIGTTELGYYGLANRLLRYPLQTSMQTYREVVFPTLARLQHDDDEMRRTYVRTVSGIALLLLPFCLGLTALADPLVAALLPQRWEPATDILALMALVGALQSLAITTGSIYLAKGRTDLSLRWQMVSSTVMMVSYTIGARWGVVGVAWGFLVGITLLTYPAFRISMKLMAGRPRDVFRPIAPTVVASMVAAGAARVASVAGERAGMAPIWSLTVGASALLAVYGGWLVVGRPRALGDLRSIVLSRRSKAPRAT